MESKWYAVVKLNDDDRTHAAIHDTPAQAWEWASGIVGSNPDYQTFLTDPAWVDDLRNLGTGCIVQGGRFSIDVSRIEPGHTCTTCGTVILPTE